MRSPTWSLGSVPPVSTSDESCLRVRVRFRLASVSARVSSWLRRPADGSSCARGLWWGHLRCRRSDEEGAAHAGSGWLGAAVLAVLGAVAAGAAAAAAGVAAAAGAGAGVAAGAAGEADGTVAVGGRAAAAAAVLAVAAVPAGRRLRLAATWAGDSCSWISIMCSPSRTVRFSGAFPERNSVT